MSLPAQSLLGFAQEEARLLPEVTKLPERYKAELRRGEHVRAQLAILRQYQVKRAVERIDYRFMEGMRRVGCIDREMALRLRVKDGMGCLNDPEYLRVLLRDNPSMRVNSQPKRFSLRVQGLRDSRPGLIQEGSGNGTRRETAAACSQLVFAHETPARPESAQAENDKGGLVLCAR